MRIARSRRAASSDAGETAPPSPISVARYPAPGVNLTGFLEAELGLGEVARKLGRGLVHAGIPFVAIPYRRIAIRQEHPLELPVSDEAPYDTNVVCLNAEYLHTFTSDVGVDFFSDRCSIGVWFWETSVFWEQNSAGFRFLDEVWVASEYVRGVVAAAADIPVLVVPLPIEEPSAPTLSRSDLGLPPGFVFLFTFDFLSHERKNPTAVVEAFTNAFAPGEGPALVVKSINGQERKPQQLEELRGAARGRADIHVLDGYVSAEEIAAMVSACDCYVSLHRSEGFGLGMAEAMSHAKPVIATGYSGNLEFMDESNSYLVPYRLTRVPADWWAYSPDAEWADPDVYAASALMRDVYENQDEARALGSRAREDVLRRCSVDRTADFIAGRLEYARDRLVTIRRSPASDARTPIIAASQLLARGVGGSLGDGRRRAPIPLVRRLLLRALWPYLEEQHRLSAALLDAVAALQRSVAEQERRLDSFKEHPRRREPPQETAVSDEANH